MSLTATARSIPGTHQEVVASPTSTSWRRPAQGMAATPVVLVAPDATVEHAAQLMIENAISHLVVVEPRDGRPVGVVSTLDVARALSR